MTLKSLNVPDAFRPLVEVDLQQLTPALYRHINQATGAVIPTQPVPPTLVVVGEKEPGVSRRHAQRLGRRRPVSPPGLCRASAMRGIWKRRRYSMPLCAHG